MPKSPKSRSLTLFYILVAYVFLQLMWWAVHIIQLTSKLGENNEYTSRRIWMIIGEGLVFFLLLSFGVYKIRKAFKQEVRLAQQKQNFALSVSHELKSPIASIKLFLQTLEKRELSEEKKIEILKKCISNADRLDGLVNNILLSNTFDSNNYELSLELYNLKAQIEDICLVFKHNNSQAKITFNYNGAEELYLDKTIIASIVTNLIDNAIKYTSDEKIIDVGITEKNEFLNISVSDNGDGISEGEKELIFEKFYRSGSEITRKAKGTGLGLYIMKELIRLLNGEIQILNNKPKGTIFNIKIPLQNKNYE